jgi:hypothetical protein
MVAHSPDGLRDFVPNIVLMALISVCRRDPRSKKKPLRRGAFTAPKQLSANYTRQFWGRYFGNTVFTAAEAAVAGSVPTVAL